MNMSANFGPDRSSRLAAYSEQDNAARMFARARLRAHMRTRDRRPPYLHRIVPMSISANFGPDRPSRLAADSEQYNTGRTNR
jgi:hypothetical protein